MPNYAIAEGVPKQSVVNYSPDVPHYKKTAPASSYAGLLVVDSTGTYGNGVALASAAYGDGSGVEGLLYQIEIPYKHPQSDTPYDITTAFSAGDSIEVVPMLVDKVYWLKGSSLTVVKGDKMICAANGLVAQSAEAHDATPLPMHTWVVMDSVTSATWVRCKYVGFVSHFTVTS